MNHVLSIKKKKHKIIHVALLMTQFGWWYWSLLLVLFYLFMVV